METWHAGRDPRGDTVHNFDSAALSSSYIFGHGYVIQELVQINTFYKLMTSFPDFITAIYVTTNEDVTVNIKIRIIGKSVMHADLGSVALTKGENRIPFIGIMKPLRNSYYCLPTSFVVISKDDTYYCPTKVVAIGLLVHGFDRARNGVNSRVRMTPSTNFVYDDGRLSIENAELGPWMKYGAFLWLLRKHYKDIITRLYRPGGLMAKRMERSIYGPEN